jgi:hypothetical protein
MKNKRLFRVFLAFCLDDLQSEVPAQVQVKKLSLESMNEAKAFLQRYYPDLSWVVVDQRIIDHGIVFATAQKQAA